MKPVFLSLINFMEGSAVWVNMNHVMRIERDQQCTTLVMDHGPGISVTETPTEIMKQLKFSA